MANPNFRPASNPNMGPTPKRTPIQLTTAALLKAGMVFQSGFGWHLSECYLQLAGDEDSQVMVDADGLVHGQHGTFALAEFQSYVLNPLLSARRRGDRD